MSVGIFKVARQSQGKNKERPMRRQKGFSLIELLIVVAIILIIAAIAIPNLMRARMAANDASAAASVRSINTAEIAYSGVYTSVGFPLTLAILGGASPCTPGVAAACLIDDSLATNGGGLGKSGYNFNATGSPSAGSAVNDQFYSTGAPLNARSGSRSYCSIQDALLRLQAPGTITLVPTYLNCTVLGAMAN